MSPWAFLKRSGEGRGRSTSAKRPAEEITSTQHTAGGLSFQKVREIFEVVQTREVIMRLPTISGGKVVHFLFSGSPITHELLESGASEVLVGYLSDAAIKKEPADGELIFRASLDEVPLKDWSCRYLLISAPIIPGTSITGLIREAGRVLEPGGEGVIIDWHPYSDEVGRALSGGGDSEQRGIEKYFRAFHEGGLVATHVREAFVDGGVKKLMETSGDKGWFEAKKQQPLVIIFFVKKRKG